MCSLAIAAGKENWICKLNKALYGTPISGNRRHRKPVETLNSLNYCRSVADHCFFNRNKGKDTYMLILYVHDVIVTSLHGRKQAEKQLEEMS